MREVIPTDLLLRLIQATPAQLAAIARILGCEDPGVETSPASKYPAPTDSVGEMVLQEVRGMAATMEKMGRDIEAVAKGNYELRQAKARLEGMQGQNLFKFVQTIDSNAFRIVCAILVHGDVAKASRALRINDSTLRLTVKTWAKRGGAYRGLADLVRWRKRRRVIGTVPFNDALLYDNGGGDNRQTVFKDLLDGLLSMTEGNWQDVCEELVEMLGDVG